MGSLKTYHSKVGMRDVLGRREMTLTPTPTTAAAHPPRTDPHKQGFVDHILRDLECAMRGASLGLAMFAYRDLLAA